MKKTNLIIACFIVLALILLFVIYFRTENKEKTVFSLFNEKLIEPVQNEKIEVYFCPREKCLQKIILELMQAKKSIKCMLYSFTHPSISKAIAFKFEKGLNVKIILEAQQISKYSQKNFLEEKRIPILIDKNPSLMHHKFCVLDEEKVLTGSTNFTHNGVESNNENSVFISDKKIAEKYLKEFEFFWKEWS